MEWCACCGVLPMPGKRLLVGAEVGFGEGAKRSERGSRLSAKCLACCQKCLFMFSDKGRFVTISVCGEQRRWSADVSRDEGEGRTESNPLSGITCGLPAGSCGVLTAWRQRSPALMAGFRWRWFQREIACRSMRTQERQIAG